MSNACREYARTLVWQSRSIYGRLVLLGSRRGSAGRYCDGAMAKRFDDDSVHEALADLHNETYDLWMTFTAVHQRKDLAWYLHEQGYTPRLMAEDWINTQRTRELVPVDVADYEAFARGLAIHLLLISAGFDESVAGPAIRAERRMPPEAPSFA